jgi:hypothetical protein
MSRSDDIGNVLPYDIDDLTHYLFKNYSALMTPTERNAYLVLLLSYKGEHSNSEKMKTHMRQRFQSADPEVLALLAQGAREFYITTRNRLLRDHSKDIFLNHCPKCGALARTPKACLCPACSHTWFETRSA